MKVSSAPRIAIANLDSVLQLSRGRKRAANRNPVHRPPSAFMAVVKVSSANLTLNANHGPAHLEPVMARPDAFSGLAVVAKTYATVKHAEVKTSAKENTASTGIARHLNLAVLVTQTVANAIAWHVIENLIALPKIARMTYVRPCMVVQQK